MSTILESADAEIQGRFMEAIREAPEQALYEHVNRKVARGYERICAAFSQFKPDSPLPTLEQVDSCEDDQQRAQLLDEFKLKTETLARVILAKDAAAAKSGRPPSAKGAYFMRSVQQYAEVSQELILVMAVLRKLQEKTVEVQNRPVSPAAPDSGSGDVSEVTTAVIDDSSAEASEEEQCPPSPPPISEKQPQQRATATRRSRRIASRGATAVGNV